MDEAKLHEFMGKLVTDMGGAAMIANVILGEELGLYRAMADSNPLWSKNSNVPFATVLQSRHACLSLVFIRSDVIDPMCFSKHKIS